MPPARTHVHAAVVSWLLSGYGSLKRSKITEWFVLNVSATLFQKKPEWSTSATGDWSWGTVVPGALKCRLMIAMIPLAFRRCT